MIKISGSLMIGLFAALSLSAGNEEFKLAKPGSPEGAAEALTLPSNEGAADCESTLFPDLLECARQRLLVAEATLDAVNHAWHDQLDRAEESEFEIAHQAWLASRDAECKEESLDVWPGREAAIDQLLCLERRILIRIQQLSTDVDAGLTRCHRPDTIVRFSCSSEHGDLVRICEDLDLHPGRGPIHIEISKADGRPEKISLGSAESSMRYNHYARFRTDYLEVAARRHSTEYRVFRHTEDSQVSFGLVVRAFEEARERRIDCAGDVFDQLSLLPRVLECDKRNALGCGAFD